MCACNEHDETVADSAFATVRSAVAKVPSCAAAMTEYRLIGSYITILRALSAWQTPLRGTARNAEGAADRQTIMPAASSRSEACDEERSNNIELDHLQTSEESKAGPSI